MKSPTGDPPMRIVFVSHSALAYGAERSLELLATELAGREDASVEVVLPSGGPLSARLRAAGIRCRIIRYYPWIGPPRSPLRLTAETAISLVAVVRLMWWFRRRTDVVVTNTGTVPWAALATTLARVPHVWIVREAARASWGWRTHYGEGLTQWVTERTAELLVANSETLASLLRGTYPGRVVAVVPPPVPAAATPPPLPSEAGLRIVCLGRLEENKGQLDLVEAIRLLRDAGRDATARLVGDTSSNYAHRLQQRVREFDLGDRVTLTGHVTDVAAEVRKAHVGVTCSRFESFGRSTAEPMAAGRPVVGARGWGTSELIDHGRNGYVYEPGDAEDLARWLTALEADRGAVERMGRHAHRSVEAFAPERVADRLVALLGTVTGGAAKPGHGRAGR